MTKNKAKLQLTKGPRSSAVIVHVPEQVSLRIVEHRLVEADLEAIVLRPVRQVHIDALNIGLVCDALNEWDVEIHSDISDVLRSRAQQEYQHQNAWRAVQYLMQPGKADVALGDFTDADHLDPHQRQAVAAATHEQISGLCIFDEQGLGKTIQALFSFHRLRQLDRVGRMIVICPKTMVGEWVSETKRFFVNRYDVEAVSGTAAEKRAVLDRAPDILAMNFETATSLQTRIRDLLHCDRGQSLLVVDESFFVKNSTALRTRAVKELRARVGRCLVLCGTPAPNSAHDLVEQFNIADGGVAFHGVKVPKDREEARNVVQNVIDERGVFIRRLKGQVMPELPSRRFQTVFVPLQPEQARAYSMVLRRLADDLKSTDEVAFKKHITSFMSRRLALLQLCSCPGAVVENYTETPAKLIALDSILEEFISKRREKVVVWSFFRNSLEVIFNRYAKYGAVRLDGSVTDSEIRRESISRFQEDDATMLFVANPAAAGSGITLHRSRVSIYESLSNQAAHYLQSLDRIHRRGQTRHVEYLVLLADQTIEKHEYDRLLRKEAISRDLLGDVVEPPLSRQAMLDEVLESMQCFDRGAAS